MCTYSQFLSALFLLWISAPGWADDVGNEKISIDRIQGEWVVDSMQIADFTICGTLAKPIRISIGKDKMSISPGVDYSSNASFYFGSNGFSSSKTVTIVFTEGHQTMTFELDETQTPVQLDLKEKQKKSIVTRQGICRLKGEELELCIALQKLPRPLDFRATKTTILFQLKRVAVEK
jgi:uncharacterized protein (TIGR03067 family)